MLFIAGVSGAVQTIVWAAGDEDVAASPRPSTADGFTLATSAADLEEALGDGEPWGPGNNRGWRITDNGRTLVLITDRLGVPATPGAEIPVEGNVFTIAVFDSEQTSYPACYRD